MVLSFICSSTTAMIATGTNCMERIMPPRTFWFDLVGFIFVVCYVYTRLELIPDSRIQDSKCWNAKLCKYLFRFNYVPVCPNPINVFSQQLAVISRARGTVPFVGWLDGSNKKAHWYSVKSGSRSYLRNKSYPNICVHERMYGCKCVCILCVFTTQLCRTHRPSLC